jgi:peroxiredoxin
VPDQLPRPTAERPWMRWTLIVAGVYNLLWGAAVVLAPTAAFGLAGLETPLYPSIWQCVGMIVGVYGVGYLAASRDPLRHWPITLVGLLGKIFGPIGFVWAASNGELPWIFGLTIITNDLVWWLPFGAILWAAAREAQGRDAPTGEPMDVPAASARAMDQHGRSLTELSTDRPALVVFLRHTGCTFCREALADLRARREEIEGGGARIVVAHQSTDEGARAVMERYGLGDVSRIADPRRELYHAFDLRRGTFRQLFGPSVWLRGLAATLRGHLVGRLEGDGFQLPGAFLVREGRIERAYRHATAADRPDYCELAAPA